MTKLCRLKALGQKTHWGIEIESDKSTLALIPLIDSVWCLIWRYTASNYAPHSFYRVHHSNKKMKSSLYYFPQKALKVSRSNFADSLVSTWRKSWSHLLTGGHSRGSKIRDYNNLAENLGDVRVKKKCWANHNAVQAGFVRVALLWARSGSNRENYKNLFCGGKKDTFLTLCCVCRLAEAATLSI